jgi:C-methyltransferase
MGTATRVPPVAAARLVERVRHHLYRLNQRLMPAPAAMMEMIVAGWLSQAITVAAELGVADALTAGPMTIDELAAAVGANSDALGRLLRALIGRGVFHHRDDGRYELNSLARTLCSDAEVSMSAAAQFYGSREQRDRWTLLGDSIRTGRSVVPALHGKGSFDYFAEDPQHDRRLGGGRLRLRRLSHDRRCRRRARATAGRHPGRDAGRSGHPV